ncbi:hypothetical protein [Novosphingobium aquimarinum]|uniref:hypothetical protein n=1 Tax=Novosphingobium aquimarinum TaxID=2682494 RepID=UPI0012EB86B6|nr:hypothetical protein [Novosphingobium aquimarinum]
MRFRNLAMVSLLTPAFALSACNQSPSETAEDDFASRIQGSPPAMQVDATPVPEAPMEPGTVTDPASSSCGARLAKDFVGQTDSPDIRAKITEAVGDKAPGGIEFVQPGGSANAKARPDRLRVMIDYTQTVRDLRCG